MARPRSEDKRNAILSAAAKVFADEGLAAPTSRIAREAGVADGTVFTYFSSKDALLNELYVALKGELRAVMLAGFPHAAPLRDRVHHVWERYVAWGASHPHKRQAMARLAISEKISPDNRLAAAAGFGELQALMEEGAALSTLGEVPPMFVGALMGAIADTTIDHMARDPAQAARYREAGFSAFWHGISS